MRERAELLDKFAESMANGYVRPNGLNHDDVLALLKDGTDHWYSADEALSAGLVDRVVNAIPMAASFQQTRFTPPAAKAAIIPVAIAASTSIKDSTMKSKITLRRQTKAPGPKLLSMPASMPPWPSMPTPSPRRR